MGRVDKRRWGERRKEGEAELAIRLTSSKEMSVEVFCVLYCRDILRKAMREGGRVSALHRVGITVAKKDPAGVVPRLFPLALCFLPLGLGGHTGLSCQNVQIGQLSETWGGVILTLRPGRRTTGTRMGRLRLVDVLRVSIYLTNFPHEEKPQIERSSRDFEEVSRGVDGGTKPKKGRTITAKHNRVEASGWLFIRSSEAR